MPLLQSATIHAYAMLRGIRWNVICSREGGRSCVIPGLFPYTNLSSPEYFDRPALLPQYDYNNDLHEAPCSDKEYTQISDLVQYFQRCGLLREWGWGPV